MQKTKKIGRRSDKVLAQQMYDLALKGRSGAEIMRDLAIPRKRAESIHYTLIKAGKLSMSSLSFSAPLVANVSERGLFIPRSWFTALGLDEAFAAGIPVRPSVRGNSLVMEPDNKGEMREQEKPVRAGSSQLAIDWDGFANDVIALGESDEPLA